MSTLLQDTFTDTDGTALTAHTMDVGSGWTQAGISDAYSILSNQTTLVGTPTFVNELVTADAGNADCVITLDCVVPNANDYFLGVAGRASDADNYWRFGIERDGSGTPYLIIYNRATGVNNVSGSNNFSVSPTGTTVTLTVTMNGTALSVAAPNVTTVSTTSSVRQSVTTHGLDTLNFASYVIGTFDNFLVTTIPSGVTYPQLERGRRGIARGIGIGAL